MTWYVAFVTPPPLKTTESSWEKYLSEQLRFGMTRRQWYALISVTIGLLWTLAVVVTFGLKLGPVHFFDVRQAPCSSAESVLPPK
jgi:hypothetical protein